MVPFILIATMLVVQYGLAMYAQQVVSGAAQDGAARGALDGSSAAAGQTIADQLVAQSGGQLITNYSSSATNTGAAVVITTQADVVKLLPLFPTITVRGSSSAALEQFRSPGP